MIVAVRGGVSISAYRGRASSGSTPATGTSSVSVARAMSAMSLPPARSIAMPHASASATVSAELNPMSAPPSVAVAESEDVTAIETSESNSQLSNVPAVEPLPKCHVPWRVAVALKALDAVPESGAP